MPDEMTYDEIQAEIRRLETLAVNRARGDLANWLDRAPEPMDPVIADAVLRKKWTPEALRRIQAQAGIPGYYLANTRPYEPPLRRDFVDRVQLTDEEKQMIRDGAGRLPTLKAVHERTGYSLKIIGAAVRGYEQEMETGTPQPDYGLLTEQEKEMIRQGDGITAARSVVNRTSFTLREIMPVVHSYRDSVADDLEEVRRTKPSGPTP